MSCLPAGIISQQGFLKNSIALNFNNSFHKQKESPRVRAQPE